MQGRRQRCIHGVAGAELALPPQHSHNHSMAWLLQGDSGSIRAHLEAVLREFEPQSAPPSRLEGLGLVSSAARDAAFEAAWNKVVTPMWQALAA